MKLSLLFFLLLFHCAISNAQTSLTVIAHVKGAPNSMSLAELKSIFRGERQRWSDNTKVVIAMMKLATPLGTAICEKVYNLPAEKVRRFWMALLFAGKVEAPEFFQTVAELEAYVSENPGTIGIIDKPVEIPNVKVILVDYKKSF